MTPYWVEFKDRGPACIETAGDADEAKLQASAYGKAVSALILPYPATPRIGIESSGCPAFCYTPSQCAGSCPKWYACSE